jgi:hypothetical protein
MSLNDKLLKAAAAAGGITPSEHFGVMLYEGDGSASHSINGGKFGAAGFFENAGVVTIPSSVIDNNKHSLSVWFNTSATSGTQTVFEFNTGNRIIFRAASTDSNKANFGGGGWFDHGISFSANTWYHLVITFNSGSPAKIYVNGSLQHTTGNISKASDGSANYLGANNSSGGNNLLGKIDQFRIFQKELSSTEVSTLYAETAATVESLDPLSEDTTDTLQVLGDTSCIATYRFENDEVDLSGNYDGTGAEIQYAAGRYGQAASFNNTYGSKMVIGAMNSVIPNNTTGVSFSFWVYLDSVNTGADYDHWFVGQEDYGGAFSDGEFSVRLYEGKVYTDYAQSGSIYRQRKATTVLSTGQWYHIVATYDTSNANITEVYLNGSLETSSNITSGGTFTTTALMQSSSNMSVGGGPTGTDGKIDQFRIFTKVLSASEVTTLYEENSLVASYRFEGNSNDDTRNHNGTDTSVTYEYGLGFQPDLVWIKERGPLAENHNLTDSTRGTNKILNSNNTNAEITSTSRITSFDSGGFTLGNNNETNDSGSTYVAWSFKANGGTTSSNTDGSITTTVQTNTQAGFSIITYTGNGTVGATIGHNLGYVPNWFAVKKRSSGATNWRVYHTYTDATNPQNYNVEFNGNGAKDDRTEWNDTMPTSSVISLNDHDSVNASGSDYVCYAWTDINGFSKFGGYTGTGAAGNLIETGFEPAFIMFKRTDSTGGWLMFDNKRNLTNPRNSRLEANNDGAEQAGSSSKFVDFYSNGFEPQVSDSEINASGGTYIYMAFAADPDTEAPTLASSFSTVAYTGNGSSNRTIEGLGFSPSLLWLKSRTTSEQHYIFDSIRGHSKYLHPNLSNAQGTDATTRLKEFLDDGFKLGNELSVNQNNEDFIAWAWKADDNEPTIFGGPARAVYKFEDNANDVTGNYNGTATNVSYVTGKFNKAADFNGSDSAFTYSTSVINVASDHSISFWLNIDTIATQMIIWNHDSNIRMTSGGNILYRRNTSGVAYDITSSTTLSTGSWYHIVATFNTSSGMALYIDNVAQGTNSYTGGVDSKSGDFGLMYRVDSNNERADGKIDQVRFYNGTLKAEQVDELYNETASDNDDLTLGAPPEAIISANANAGFSIVKYEGTGVAGTKVLHGLSSAPEMVIAKRLNSAQNWVVFHTSIGATKYLELNDSRAEDTASTVWNNTAPSATAVTFGTSSLGNGSGDDYIMYCFHSVSGYSKIGTYTGSGTSSTQSINTGFQPDWILIKDYIGGGSWWIQDSVRGDDKWLKANNSNAETSVSYVDFTSTGFDVTGGLNDSSVGSKFLYMAFKIN